MTSHFLFLPFYLLVSRGALLLVGGVTFVHVLRIGHDITIQACYENITLVEHFSS